MIVLILPIIVISACFAIVMTRFGSQSRGGGPDWPEIADRVEGGRPIGDY